MKLVDLGKIDVIISRSHSKLGFLGANALGECRSHPGLCGLGYDTSEFESCEDQIELPLLARVSKTFVVHDDGHVTLRARFPSAIT